MRRDDLLPTLVVAASYPLYIQLDALPRADAVGPPVPDRYPWLLAALAVAWLGARAGTLRQGAVIGALLALAALAAYTDDAAVTGVAMRPAPLAFGACAVLAAGHAAGCSWRWLRAKP